MFAYCLNNPITYCDATGNLPTRNDIVGCQYMLEGGTGQYSGYVTIPGTTELISEETKQKIELTVKDMCNTTVAIGSAIYNNIEFSAGVGQGLAGEVLISDIGVDSGAYANYACWKLSDGQWSFGQEIYTGATASIIFDIGAAHREFRGADGVWHTTEHWIGYNDNQNSVTIWGSSCYVLFIGYSINIGIDPIGLFEDLDAI